MKAYITVGVSDFPCCLPDLSLCLSPGVAAVDPTATAWPLATFLNGKGVYARTDTRGLSYGQAPSPLRAKGQAGSWGPRRNGHQRSRARPSRENGVTPPPFYSFFVQARGNTGCHSLRLRASRWQQYIAPYYSSRSAQRQRVVEVEHEVAILLAAKATGREAALWGRC